MSLSSCKPEELKPFSKTVAYLAQQQVNILAAHAYADAALHAADEAGVGIDYESAGAAFDAVTAKFKGSKMDKLIDDAFARINLLIEARSIEKPKPGERDYMVREHLDQLSELQLQLASAVQSNELPPESMEAFTSALAVATVKQARQDWVDTAIRRERSIGTRGPQ